jgi:hypothetical protein
LHASCTDLRRTASHAEVMLTVDEPAAISGRRAPGALSSLHVSVGAAVRPAALLADDRLTAETRFDPQSGPAAATWAARATSRLGRAAASRGLPNPGSIAKLQWAPERPVSGDPGST